VDYNSVIQVVVTMIVKPIVRCHLRVTLTLFQRREPSDPAVVASMVVRNVGNLSLTCMTLHETSVTCLLPVWRYSPGDTQTDSSSQWQSHNLQHCDFNEWFGKLWIQRTDCNITVQRLDWRAIKKLRHPSFDVKLSDLNG